MCKLFEVTHPTLEHLKLRNGFINLPGFLQKLWACIFMKSIYRKVSKNGNHCTLLGNTSYHIKKRNFLSFKYNIFKYDIFKDYVFR